MDRTPPLLLLLLLLHTIHTTHANAPPSLYRPILVDPTRPLFFFLTESGSQHVKEKDDFPLRYVVQWTNVPNESLITYIMCTHSTYYCRSIFVRDSVQRTKSCMYIHTYYTWYVVCVTNQPLSVPSSTTFKLALMVRTLPSFCFRCRHSKLT